jgi:hypothetical protein
LESSESQLLRFFLPVKKYSKLAAVRPEDIFSQKQLFLREFGANSIFSNRQVYFSIFILALRDVIVIFRTSKNTAENTCF